jgi:DNA-binding NarL/FixJ family response regulator
MVRVLVVDDFEEWRQMACAAVSEIPSLVVVAEAAGGVEAVQKARELRPDLVLLDISLPDLNGIEIARTLRTISPESKIIFLTENRCPDIIEEAYRAGASGYVIKSSAPMHLRAAIQAALAKS